MFLQLKYTYKLYMYAFISSLYLCITITQERIFSNSQQRFFYSHATSQTTQWHYPTASEARDPAIAKMRVDHNTQDAHSRRLS